MQYVVLFESLPVAKNIALSLMSIYSGINYSEKIHTGEVIRWNTSRLNGISYFINKITAERLSNRRYKQNLNNKINMSNRVT